MDRLFKAMWIKLTADKKKFGAMCGLMVVGMLLWGRLVIIQHIPRTGYADPAKSAASADKAKKKADQAQPTKPKELPALTLTAAPWTGRDLFQVSDVLRPALPAESEKTNQNLPKSQAESSENTEDPVLVRREQIRLEAQTLRLDSLMLGQRPAAILNGQFLTVGEQVNGFTLLEVRDRSVLVGKEDEQFEIQIRSSSTPTHKRRS